MAHHQVYYGVDVPSSLPTVQTREYATLILYSALSIELCRFAICKPLPLAVKIIDFVRFLNWNLGSDNNPIKAVESSRHAYSLLHGELQPQLLAEQEGRNWRNNKMSSVPFDWQRSMIFVLLASWPLRKSKPFVSNELSLPPFGCIYNTMT